MDTYLHYTYLYSYMHVTRYHIYANPIIRAREAESYPKICTLYNIHIFEFLAKSP